MDSRLLTEHWHNDNVTVTVTCDAQNCLAEIYVTHADSASANVEVLHRSRDEKTGLPMGPAITVFRQACRLQSLKDGTRSFARFWLPKSIAKRLRDHFFRVRFAE